MTKLPLKTVITLTELERKRVYRVVYASWHANAPEPDDLGDDMTKVLRSFFKFPYYYYSIL